MKGKRGDAGLSLVMYALFEIAIIAMFLAASFMKVNAAVNDQTYYQRFVARDVAMTVDAMQSAEGDFNILYSYSTPKPSTLDIVLRKTMIEVYDSKQRGNDNKIPISFLFGYGGNVSIEESILEHSDEKRYYGADQEEFFATAFKIRKYHGNVSFVQVEEGGDGVR
ncbi:hypothetical protein JW826_00320 [Candidatus Woesearchaeota archaeon]|nr:hypothetical protein [Candidatus Woesearchaeota archaeon]